MKVCIDITPFATANFDRGGVYRYIRQLVNAIAEIDHTNDYHLFASLFRPGAYQRFHREGKAYLPGGANFSVQVSRIPARVWQGLHLPAWCITGKFDVFHGCFDFLPPLFPRAGVVTIHDVRYLEDSSEEVNEEWLDILNRKATPAQVYVDDYLARFGLFDRLKKQMPLTIGRAAKVITVSQFSKDRIVSKLGIDSSKVAVVYHGTDHRPSPGQPEAVSLEQGVLRRRYILYAGKYDPQKNIIGILRAFKEFVRIHPEFFLVLAGPQNWYFFIIKEEVERLHLTAHVVFAGYVGDPELLQLYKSAALFIMPSFYEGFGLPLLEAMACGTPVVSSNVASLPEIAGDAALLTDPLDIEGMASAMLQVVDNKRLRSEMIARGLHRAAQFSWEKAARETIKVYANVCRGIAGS